MKREIIGQGAIPLLAAVIITAIVVGATVYLLIPQAEEVEIKYVCPYDEEEFLTIADLEDYMNTNYPVITPVTSKYIIYATAMEPGLDPFWAAAANGVTTAGKIFPEVDAHYIGITEPTPEAINNALETAIAGDADVIIVGAWFGAATDEVLFKAADSGITLICFQNPEKRPEGPPYISFVGMDEATVGYIIADETLKRFPNITRAAVGIYYPGTYSHEVKAEGVLERLAEEGIPCEKINLTDDPETMRTMWDAYLTANPDTNMLFQVGPKGLDAALSVIDERGLRGNVHCSSCDFSEIYPAAFDDGTLIVTVLQQPFMIGFTSVEVAYKYLEYSIIPPEVIATGPTVIDNTNKDLAIAQMEKVGVA